MAKINQEEYEILKNLDEKWKWIARNNLYGGHLEAHTTEPQRMYDSHWSNGDMTQKIMGEDQLFQFIQWENEPYNIQDLIWEYEFKELTEFILEEEKETFKKLAESEEKEVKDIEWLKEWFSNDEKHYSGEYILSKINQLEVEILSQEWIDEHIDDADVRGSRQAFIHVEDLQNLLVPKQEEVDQAYKAGYEKGKEHATRNRLPVIPQYVADFIKVRKGTEAYSLKYILCISVERSEKEQYKEVYDWIAENDDVFASAWLAYPNIEVEEEQKYFVQDNRHSLLCKWGSEDGWKVINTSVAIEEDLPMELLNYGLTEQEIKDYDERYMAFAVPVEEVEE